MESVFSRGPLWKNVHFVECNSSSEIIPGQTRKPLCQELTISLGTQGAKLEYTPTGPGCVPPLTLAACRPSWDDYFDFNKTLTEMANHLMEEDGQQAVMAPKAGATPKKKEAVPIVALPAPLPANEGIVFIPTSEFPGIQHELGSRENPIYLSNAKTEALNSGTCPIRDVDAEDKAKMLGHFSDALHKMASSIIDLEDGYFNALHEVIIKTDKVLRDISRIDMHYVSRVVTVMTTWQEAVQAAASHMEDVDVTIYLAHWKDVRRATKEYMATVIKAREEHDTAHAKEQETWKKAIKADEGIVCTRMCRRFLKFA